jgi:hypothetical protein
VDGHRILLLPVGILAVLVLMGGPGPSGPHLLFELRTPDDVQALTAATWDRFLGVFHARHDCIPPVTLRTVTDLDGRARYEPERRRILLQVPATASQLETALVHEFAHHLEFSCADHEELRSAFRRAQGLPAQTGWFEGQRWEDTPSEQFAEATVEVVVGRRTLHRQLFISAEAKAVIMRWAAGS